MSVVLLGAVAVTAGLLVLVLVAVWRGPTIYDRMVAVAQATVGTLVLLVLVGFLSGRPSLFLDVALTYALLATVVPIALSAYVDRRQDEAADDAAGSADDGQAPT